MLDAHQGGRKVVELQLDSGHVVWVTPLSEYLVISIRKKIEAETPPVDKAAYQTELTDSVIPGEMVFAPGQEEAYNAAVQARALKVLNDTYLNWLLIAVDLPGGREAFIDRYKHELTQARKYADLSADDWEAVLHNFIISSKRDLQTLFSVASMNLPIEEAEVHNGLLIFRPGLRGDIRAGEQPNGIHDTAVPSGVTGAGELVAQSPV